MTVLPYGATIAGLSAPDRHGDLRNVVLNLPHYTVAHPYFGAVVGRYANRIARGQFVLNGRRYRLTLNDGPNALHGGPTGFSRRLWHVANYDGKAATLTYQSAAGEEGYPGALSVQVVYAVDWNEVHIGYRAEADADTVINITNHSYFNLGGGPTILDHTLQVSADAYTPVDTTLVPTGEIAPISGTPFDFLLPQPIGARIGQPHPQLLRAGGYDHNWVLKGGEGRRPSLAAVLHDPATGRRLSVSTTEPGLQVYAGTQLDGTFGYRRFGGVALETQHFPDSPNHPHFPSTMLRAGAIYRSTTIWRFDTR